MVKQVIQFIKKCFCKHNSDYARIDIDSLSMEMKKFYKYNRPHEISVIVPRVEIREEIKTPIYSRTKETIYNSVTIVNAPRAPISGEDEQKITPPKIGTNSNQKKKSQRK